MFSVMAGDADASAALCEDIKMLGSGAQLHESSLKVLKVFGERVDLRNRLNPFAPNLDGGQEEPTAMYIHSIERLNKSRTYYSGLLKELETKLQRARERRIQEEKLAAEEEKQRQIAEQQMNSLNQEKSEMLKALENLEAKFLSDEMKIAQIKKAAGVSDTPSPHQKAPAQLPVVLREEKRIPFDRKR
jgi:chromosome segregation ATPase